MVHSESVDSHAEIETSRVRVVGRRADADSVGRLYPREEGDRELGRGRSQHAVMMEDTQSIVTSRRNSTCTITSVQSFCTDICTDICSIDDTVRAASNINDNRLLLDRLASQLF